MFKEFRKAGWAEGGNCAPSVLADAPAGGHEVSHTDQRLIFTNTFNPFFNANLRRVDYADHRPAQKISVHVKAVHQSILPKAKLRF